MAYCPKCGVKVDHGGKDCPLCDFPIPVVEEEVEEQTHPFPTPENVYPKEFKAIKKRIFKNIAVFLLLAVVVMYFQNILLQGTLTWARYSVAATFFLLAYIAVFLNFIPNPYFFVTASALITLGFLFTMDWIGGELNWFWSLGLPLVAGIFLLSLIGVFAYRHLKRKPLILAGVFMMLAGLYFIVVEGAVTGYFFGKIHLFWSYIGGIPLSALGLSMLYFHYYFPQSMKEQIKRRFHT